MHNSNPAYRDWEKRSLTAHYGPVHLLIHSTGRCNLSCFMCYHAYIDDMEVKIDFKKLDPFLQNAETATFAGSETLLMTSNINQVAGIILEHIVNSFPGIDLTIFTNGILLNEETAAFAIKHYTNVFVSVDSLDPAVYEKIRGKPVLDKVLANIRYLSDLKAQNGLGSGDPPFININSIVMDSTLDGLKDVAVKLAELGGHCHWLLTFQDIFDPWFEYIGVEKRLLKVKSPSAVNNLISRHRSIVAGESIKQDDQTKMRLENARRELGEIYSANGLMFEDRSRSINLAPRKKPPSGLEEVCPQPWLNAFIREDGSVYGCCANTTLLGNINRQTFDEIWNGPAARKLRASMISGEMKGCIWSGCDSPYDYSCPTVARSESGSGQNQTVKLQVRAQPIR